jgi:hypothetical protein
VEGFDAPNVLQENKARTSQRDSGRGARKERSMKKFLQRLHMLRDRRLGDMQNAGRATQALLFCHLAENMQSVIEHTLLSHKM